MSPCFLFLIWTVSQVFFDSYAFASIRDSFSVALVISDFSYFPASYFSKTGVFSPHKGLEPLSVGSKVERASELGSGTRWKFCPFVSCCHFDFSAKFFRVFCFYLTAHRDCFLIAVVYSEFLCFLAFSSVKKRSFGHTQETQTLENWNKVSTLHRLS